MLALIFGGAYYKNMEARDFHPRLGINPGSLKLTKLDAVAKVKIAYATTR